MARDFIVACDVDDVVADLVSEWLFQYNHDFNDALTASDILSWDISAYTKPECGLRIYDYLAPSSLYDNVAPIPGALAGINRLREDGCRVAFITSGNHPRKPEWLHANGMLEKPSRGGSPDYVVAHDKSLIRADVMIDDNPDNLCNFAGVRILFDRPWNRSSGISAIRCANWNEVVAHVLSV